MRLGKVERGHRWIDKLRFVWRRLRPGGKPVTDIQRALLYRADFFGTPFERYWREAQYDAPATLSTGERQVLAAIISQTNRCFFCSVGHAEAASRYVPVDTVDAMLSGQDSMGPKMRLLADFARKLTLAPADVGPEDVRLLREQGIGDADIEVTIHLCGAYGIINRVADGLGFAVPDIYHLEVEPTSGRIVVGSRRVADAS
jgi:uncharacterized peroxidase-related enzyme